LIDTEKNEISGYKYGRTPYLAVIKNIGGKMREFKAVFIDNKLSVIRFLKTHLNRHEASEEMAKFEEKKEGL